MTTRIRLLALLTTTLAACSPPAAPQAGSGQTPPPLLGAGQAPPPLLGAGQAPFEFDGHIFFTAMINGDSVRLLYDPIDGVMLDRNYMRQRPTLHRDWRAMGDPGPTMVGGAGAAEVEVTFTDSVLVVLGPIRRSFARLPVIPLDSMMSGAIAGTPDGLLGTSLLAVYALQLDFATRKATFHDPATVDTTGWQVLPLEFVGARAITPITITVGDSVQHTLRAQVDLGMSPNVRISTREVNARNLLRHAGTTTAGGRGLGGDLTSMVWKNVTVHLGSIASPPLDVLLARESTGGDADPPYDALIGLGLLSQFDVIYDPTNARMLVRAAEPRASARGDR